MNDISEIKSYFRDIRLDNCLSKYNFSISDKNIDDKFDFLRGNKKLMKYANSIGAILTGSRAIKCYTIDNKSLLKREPNDWDFLISKEMAFDIFDKFNIDYNLKDSVVNVNSELITIHPAYSDSVRYLTKDVQFIIKDKLPNYTECSKYKITNFDYVINEKIKLASIRSGKKHIKDLNQIIIRLNNINKL